MMKQLLVRTLKYPVQMRDATTHSHLMIEVLRIPSVTMEADAPASSNSDVIAPLKNATFSEHGEAASNRSDQVWVEHDDKQKQMLERDALQGVDVLGVHRCLGLGGVAQMDRLAHLRKLSSECESSLLQLKQHQICRQLRTLDIKSYLLRRHLAAEGLVDIEAKEEHQGTALVSKLTRNMRASLVKQLVQFLQAHHQVSNATHRNTSQIKTQDGHLYE